MDNETKVAIAGLLEMSRELIRSTSEIRMLALRMQDALVKANVAGYLEAYNCHETGPFPKLIGSNVRLSHLLELEIHRLGKVYPNKSAF
jgi:hypothetical protein